MANFCIPRELVAKLKQAAKEGNINIEEMYGMDSKERRGLFEKYVDPETAKGINAGFEKAMASDQQAALSRWVKSTFTEKELKAPTTKDILTKINDLEKQGLLTPEGEKAFLEDAVAEKLGAKVTAEEAKKISEHSQKLEKLAPDVSEVGTHTLEYYKAKREMENYLQSLTPASNLRVFTSTIGRGAMLLSFKSPLVNVISNSVMGFMSKAERTILTRKFNGLNSDFSNKFMKHAIKVYKETGYDLSRFQAFEGGIKTLGEEYAHSQGKGSIRKIGRFYEDIAFNKLQGLPDATFAAFHFSDSANLSSTLLAAKEGLRGKEAKARSLEILKDAFKEAPETKEGQAVRSQAEADALYATYTNKTLASKTGLGLRSLLNTATGDFRLGDVTDPFVKTPANVLAAGLDYSGMTVTAKMSEGILKTLNDVAHRREFDKSNFANVNKYMVRAGLGLTFAYVISQMIQPQDFQGDYPISPKDKQLYNLRNAVTNAIRVGDKWVSLDYLGPLGAPLIGFLYAKKYGGGAANSVFNFGKGSISTLQHFPGADEASQIFAYLKNLQNDNTPVDKAAQQTVKDFLGFMTSRTIPGIVNDIGKATDKYVRATDRNSITDTLQSQLPFLRKGLPISTTIFGDKQETEPWLSTLLFGGRVKTNQDSTIINELVNLKQAGALPSITDVSKTSPRSRDLKSQIGEKMFQGAMGYMGEHLKQNFLDTINDPDYKSADPQDRQNKLNKVKEATFKDMLDVFGYVKPEKK